MTNPSSGFLSVAQIMANLRAAIQNPATVVVPPPVEPVVEEPDPVFVDLLCTVCRGEGFFMGNRCVLCEQQAEIVQSLE